MPAQQKSKKEKKRQCALVHIFPGRIFMYLSSFIPESEYLTMHSSGAGMC